MDIMEPGYKMLGSTGTQYLNPDYIQPLPTMLDSKNSPLALLAQTCSSIGKDSGSSSKLSLPSLNEKKEHRENIGGGDATSSSSSKHRSTSDSPIVGNSGGSNRGGEATTRSRGRTGEKSSSKDCSSSRSSSSDAGGRGERGERGGGGGGENSPKSRIHSSRPLSSLVSGSGNCTPSSAAVSSGSYHRDYGTSRGGGGASSSSTSGPSGVSLPSSSAINNNKITSGDVSSLLFDGYSDEILKSSAGLLHQQHSLQEALRLQHEGLQSLQAAAGLGHLPSSYAPLLFGHPLAAAALDPLMYSYSASLAAVHGLALNSHKLPTLSPYMSYARVSTAAGGSTLVPVCKDPYCSTGSMPPSLHSTYGLQSSTGGGPCGAGCPQCGGNGVAHDKSHRCPGPSPATSLANGGLGADGGQFSSSIYPLSLPPLLGMAAAHLGIGMTPYACSWLSGSEFCGKRFSKAEDLLHHLRTHASSGDPAHTPFPLPGVPLPTPGFGGPGSGTGHPFSIPGSLSPSSFLQQSGQAYPRSLTPNSLLNASRYHPYKSPFAAVLPVSTGTGGLPMMGSPLDAYYSSPYALFGHRIGAAAVGP